VSAKGVSRGEVRLGRVGPSSTVYQVRARHRHRRPERARSVPPSARSGRRHCGQRRQQVVLDDRRAFAEGEPDRIRERTGHSKADRKVRGRYLGGKFHSAGDGATTVSCRCRGRAESDSGNDPPAAQGASTALGRRRGHGGDGPQDQPSKASSRSWRSASGTWLDVETKDQEGRSGTAESGRGKAKHPKPTEEKDET
jgi:hypothetical protein